MKTAYIFHDAFNDEFSDWYPWMKTELEKLGYVTFVPQFPTPAAQSYASWRAVIKNYIATFDGETIFIGHGTGGAFALRLVEELSQKIRGVFLVASYAEPIGHIGYDRLNETFLQHEFDWKKIIENHFCRAVIAGQDDPFVPLEIADRLGENLGETAIIIPEGGHLNKASGFSQAVPILHIIVDTLRSIDKSITIETPPEETPLAEPEPEQETAQEPYQEPTSPQPQQISPASVRTMYADMSVLVNSHQGTVASSLLQKARNDEQDKQATSPISTQNIIYVIGSLICCIGIGFVGWTIYEKTIPAAVIARPIEIPSLIRAEKHTRISLDESPAFILEKTIRETLSVIPKGTGEVHDIFYTQGARRATLFETLNQLAISPLPENLDQILLGTSLGNDIYFMHGVLSGNSDNHHFLVIRFNDYDQAFKVMQSWESTLVRSLGVFLDIPDQVLRSRLTGDIFSDETVFNRNVRTLRNEDSFEIGYFFLNEQSLVIVDSLETIPEIINRFSNQQIY